MQSRSSRSFPENALKREYPRELSSPDEFIVPHHLPAGTCERVRLLRGDREMHVELAGRWPGGKPLDDEFVSADARRVWGLHAMVLALTPAMRCAWLEPTATRGSVRPAST